MADMTGNTGSTANTGTNMINFQVRHHGRVSQTGIYFAKFLRMFIYEADWKVLPMAALIAGLVSIVIAKAFFQTSEGTRVGTLAFACICIWNGCFNSIQVVCRERDVLKREHRSGMHVSSYVVAHMLYQCLLCVMQTIVTLYVTNLLGVHYPAKGIFTPWMIVDFGITMFLITYAADMMSLFISSLCHSTTTAMTIMPFVLIFQLVFSGGVIPLPKIATPITLLTISCPGMNAMSAQADVNNLPYAMVDTTIDTLRENEIRATITLGQVLDVLGDSDNAAIAKLRGIHVSEASTLGEMVRSIEKDEDYADIRDTEVFEGCTFGALVGAIDSLGILDDYKNTKVSDVTTVGELIDEFAAEKDVQKNRDASFTIETSFGDVLSMVGEDNVRSFLAESTANSSYNPNYECTVDNIIKNWLHVLIFVAVFALASVIVLEFIDKDKR